MTIKKGFTLVEILVVATIIMVLAGIGFVSYASLSRQSRDSRRRADLQNLRSALEFYRSDYDTYPLTDDLDDLVTGEYLNSIPTDPKDSSQYVYCSVNGSEYELCTNLEGVDNPISCCSATYDYKLTPLGEATQ